MEFRYHLPVNLMFGRGKVNEIGREAVRFGSKALVVTGSSSTKRSGLLGRVLSLLENEKIECTVFDKAVPNPTTAISEEGAVTAKENGCDMVIALGGGSVIDCAKGIAFIAQNGGDINDYIYGRLHSEKALPIIAVPTTCGTGSEGNGFAVLTNTDNGDKKSLRSNAIIPKVSVIDPELMQTMPLSLLASVGFDALCHSMEAYLSKISQPMTDALSLQGMKLIADNLSALYHGSKDLVAWDNVTWASTVGGMVINTAGVALPHGMEHPASGLKNIVHGKGLAALTPVITDESCTFAPERYLDISRILGGKSAFDCGDAIRKLLADIGLGTTLSQQGITEDDIPWMTENCFKVSAASIQNHPMTADKDKVYRLYEKAL